MKATTTQDGSEIDHGERGFGQASVKNSPPAWNHLLRLGLIAAAGLLLTAARPAWAGDTNSTAIKPYPIDHCLICGDTVSGTNAAVGFNYQGQELKFCCQRCVKAFKRDPAKYLQKLHDAENAETVKNDAPGEKIRTQ